MYLNLIIVLISLWVSSIIFFSAIIAPTVFKTLDEKSAGLFLRAFFPKYYNFGLILGLSALIIMILTGLIGIFNLFSLIALIGMTVFLCVLDKIEHTSLAMAWCICNQFFSICPLQHASMSLCEFA